MAVDPVTATMMVGQGVTELGSMFFGHQVEKANTAIKNAGDKINYWTQWQHTNEQNWFQYEDQLAQWHTNAKYAADVRTYELEIQKEQALYKGDVAAMATKSLGEKLADLEGRWYEQEAADEMQMNQLRIQTDIDSARKKMRGRGKGVAVGRTMQGIQAVMDNQWAANVSNRKLTRQFRVADKLSAQQALQAATSNEINSVRFYTPKPQRDVVKPQEPRDVKGFEPIPTPGPSDSALAFRMLGSAINTGIGIRKHDLAYSASGSGGKQGRGVGEGGKAG